MRTARDRLRDRGESKLGAPRQGCRGTGLPRPPAAAPTELAATCDRLLYAQGSLIRLHALTESGRELATSPDDQPADGANEDTEMASQLGTLAGKATLLTLLDTGQELIVPARAADGRVMFVSVSRKDIARRTVLHGIGSSAVGIGLTSTPPTNGAPPTHSGTAHSGTAHSGTAHSGTALATLADHPIEHFQRLRQVLIENDHLFGPRRVIPFVREQINIMQQLRSCWRGTDQQALISAQAQYTQFCGWLYQDAGEHHLAESCVDRALALSHLVTDHDLTVYILASKAHLAGDMRISVDAIGAAEQALSMAPPRSLLAASAATIAGHGYALSGDHVKMERTYERAHELLAISDPDPNSLFGWSVSEKWITLSRARSLTVLGNHHHAVEIFQHTITDLPTHKLRDRGVYLARAALANAGAREPEHAVTLGLEALTIGLQTASARILTELCQLDDALAPWHTVPAVADFQAAMQDTILRQA